MAKKKKKKKSDEWFACPGCGMQGELGPNGDEDDYSFVQVCTQLAQIEVLGFQNGVPVYANEHGKLRTHDTEKFHVMGYIDGEPLPNGTDYSRSGELFVDKIDFYFCLACKHPFTAAAFAPIDKKQIEQAARDLDRFLT